MAPAESTAAILRAQRMNRDIAIWARGIDRDQFNPERRDMDGAAAFGIADDEMVIAFLGRVVMEKGLDVFADAIHAFATLGLKHRVLVIGEGPGTAMVRGAAARSDLHSASKPATTLPARSPARTSSSIRRSPRRLAM